MLTGDKLSTAMQIAVSAGMARDLAAFHKIDSANPDALEAQLHSLTRCARGGGPIDDEGISPSFANMLTAPPQRLRSAGGAAAAIVIAGSAFAVMDASAKLQLVLACISCPCVVCCRLTPGQKAEIVHLVPCTLQPAPSAPPVFFCNNLNLLCFCNNLNMYAPPGCLSPRLQCVCCACLASTAPLSPSATAATTCL